MKYFGKKSISSFMSGLLHAAWYFVLVMSIVGALFGIAVIIISSVPLDEHTASEMAKAFNSMSVKDQKSWEMFKNLPAAVKIIMMPYFGAVVVLLLQIIKKSRLLFINFKNDILFNKSNVLIISKISRLNIGFSILTFNLSSLVVSVFLLMICEIFKRGSALQEEHDLTV